MTAPRPHSLLLALLVALQAAVAAAPASASAPGAATALTHLAGVPAARLMERLQTSHDRVNQALADRAAKLKAYEAAAQGRERSAARVEAMKREGTRGDALDKALREALVKDEAAQRTRSALLAAEAEVARRGAELLQIYDAVLVEKGREVKELSPQDPRLGRAVAAYRKLAEQRAAVRKALQPVLVAESGGGLSLDRVRANPDDDVETLLEKADLARDLEERFLRQAEQVRRRIEELKEEQDLASDTLGLHDQGQLFDEGDYRPVFTGGQATSGPQRAGAFATGPTAFAGGGAALADAERSEATPPPAGDESQGPMAPPADAPTDFNDGDSAAEDDVGTPDPSPGLHGGIDTGGSPDRSSDGSPPPAVVGRALPAEQVFLGAGAAADVTLKSLMASDELTLEQLKQLEKRLQREAQAMRKENARIQKQLHGQMKR